MLAYGAYKLATLTQGALWATSTAVCLAVVFGPHKWFAGASHEGWDAVIYAATHRTAWSIGLGWLTFACATGRGGLINGLLSWKAFIPMSRLSFSAFMLQTVVLISRTMVARDRLIFSHAFMVSVRRILEVYDNHYELTPLTLFLNGDWTRASSRFDERCLVDSQ